MDFFDYIFRYYTARLDFYEGLDIGALNQEILLDVLAEASALKKFMYDNKEEGYEDTYNEFCSRLDAVGRLDRFISQGLVETGNTEEGLFYLYPYNIKDSFNLDCPTKIYELKDFLEKLENLQETDLDQDLAKHTSKSWLDKTDLVLSEMAIYTNWAYTAKPGNGFICLLRDALIPYLGFRQKGADAVPLLLSRKFFAPYGNVFYRCITPPIYDIISVNPQTGFQELRSQYKQQLLACIDKELAEAIKAAKHYLSSVIKTSETYTVIESGVQGSMPLFAGSIAQNISGFLMYTTAPWLKAQYQDIIFRKNYNYLREMETLVCQNYLFDFHSFHGGKVYIQEYQDPIIRNLAYYEILAYRKKLAQIWQ